MTEESLVFEYEFSCGRKAMHNGFTTFLIKKINELEQQEQNAFEAGRLVEATGEHDVWKYPTFKSYKERKT